MLLRSLPLYAARVVSVSLIESMPSPGKGESIPGSHATLTFHLHRFHDKESFGVDCAFEPFSGSEKQCFVRGMDTNLIASSAALQSVLGDRKPAHTRSIRVTSINGIAKLTKTTVRELFGTKSDVVVQCTVSTAVTSTPDPRCVDTGAEGDDDDAEAAHTPKRPRRNAKIPVTDAFPADDIDVGSSSPKNAAKRRGWRTRGLSRKHPKVSKKRRRYSGARSPVQERISDDTDLTVDDSVSTDAEALSTAVTSGADNINAAGVETLHKLEPETAVMPRRTRGRHPRKRDALLDPKWRGTTSEQETPDDVWFTHAESTPLGNGEDGDARLEKVAVPTRKRRGRPPKTTMVDAPTEAETTEAAKPGRRRMASDLSELKQKKTSRRPGRPRKQDKAEEERELTQIPVASLREEPEDQAEGIDAELEL
ncbi:hypothetical protein, unknown function [Leishmania tarentolae]|uniref:Uncharacterized protein n=1 Tax=Leishmania tarentolae TaxID=5689 RepID=A0A640KU85_LEITA|nr:hypothetical protein, unknown function [Leishmania tarentolae]